MRPTGAAPLVTMIAELMLLAFPGAARGQNGEVRVPPQADVNKCEYPLPPHARLRLGCPRFVQATPVHELRVIGDGPVTATREGSNPGDVWRIRFWAADSGL